jgi:hypothetical protein
LEEKTLAEKKTKKHEREGNTASEEKKQNWTGIQEVSKNRLKHNMHKPVRGLPDI